MLNTSTNELTDRKKVCLGTQAITLQAYSSENVTRVFAASDFPAVIYSDNKTILHSNVYLKEVSHMCPFHTADFPNRYVVFCCPTFIPIVVSGSCTSMKNLLLRMALNHYS